MHATQCSGLPEVPNTRQGAWKELSASADAHLSPPATAHSQPVPTPAREPSHPPQLWSSSPEQPSSQSLTAPSPPLSPNGPPSGTADKECNHEAAQNPQPNATQGIACSAGAGAPAAGAAGEQPNAAEQHSGLFAPRAAPTACPVVAPRKCSFELLPGLPPVAVDVPHGMTLAQAEARAVEKAGLQLMDPPRRTFEYLFPDWADPAIQLCLNKVLNTRPSVPASDPESRNTHVQAMLTPFQYLDPSTLTFLKCWFGVGCAPPTAVVQNVHSACRKCQATCVSFVELPLFWGLPPHAVAVLIVASTTRAEFNYSSLRLRRRKVSASSQRSRAARTTSPKLSAPDGALDTRPCSRDFRFAAMPCNVYP